MVISIDWTQATVQMIGLAVTAIGMIAICAVVDHVICRSVRGKLRR